MKTLLGTLAALTAVTTAFAAGSHHPTPHHPAAKPAAAKTALVCPVTGNKIASVKAAGGHSTYKGKTYYFCCASCKPAFDKDPEKYIKKSAGKPGKGA